MHWIWEKSHVIHTHTYKHDTVHECLPVFVRTYICTYHKHNPWCTYRCISSCLLYIRMQYIYIHTYTSIYIHMGNLFTHNAYLHIYSHTYTNLFKQIYAFLTDGYHLCVPCLTPCWFLFPKLFQREFQEASCHWVLHSGGKNICLFWKFLPSNGKH